MLILAVGFGSWLARPSSGQPVAASPSASSNARVTPAPTAPPQSAVPVSSSAPKTQVDHGVVYFPRDGLPPIGVHVPGLATDDTVGVPEITPVVVLKLKPAGSAGLIA